MLTAVPVGVAGAAPHAARGGQPARSAQVRGDRDRPEDRQDRLGAASRKEQAPHEASHPRERHLGVGLGRDDGEHVIASFDSFGYYAYDMNGKLVWQKDLGDKRMRSTFGEGSTPALYGNRLVVAWDHQGQSFVAAFDKRTGQEIWRQNRTEIDTWATPLVVAGERPAAGHHRAMNQVTSYDLETGDVVWFTRRT